MTSDDLQQLPQPTRTYEGLIGLLPGVSPPNASSGGTNNPARSMEINVNGTSASGTNVSIDGVSATNPWVQFYSTAVPSTEAIETVNVVTASSLADQGAMNGGGIHVQIRSGSNSFHGSAYWYNENNALKAKPFFQPAGTEKPKYIDNDAGGTFGGPILKDKLFFFGSYEGDFLREAAGSFYTLPTPDMAQGILASPTPIFDPATGNADGSGQNPVSTRLGRRLHHPRKSNQSDLAKAHSADCPAAFRTEFSLTTCTSTPLCPITCKRSTPKSTGTQRRS